MKQIERNVYNEVSAFSTRAYETGNEDFGCGVFESMLIQVMEELPKKKRDVFLDRLQYIDNTFLVMMKEVA
jgi:hypothetical protein